MLHHLPHLSQQGILHQEKKTGVSSFLTGENDGSAPHPPPKHRHKHKARGHAESDREKLWSSHSRCCLLTLNDVWPNGGLYELRGGGGRGVRHKRSPFCKKAGVDVALGRRLGDGGGIGEVRPGDTLRPGAALRHFALQARGNVWSLEDVY